VIDISKLTKDKFGIGEAVLALAQEVENKIKDRYQEIDTLCAYNQYRVLAAFREAGVSETHFAGTTGYGYDDRGREITDIVFASVFGTEDALVRHNIISGTHAISLCLFGVLRPNDTLLSVTGKPYDTLQGVISGKGVGSLADFGVSYAQVELKCDGKVDFDAIKAKMSPKVKAVFIQRSKGYDWRDSLSSEEIGEIIKFVKSIKNDTVCIVDNCYGEFAQIHEPSHFDADLTAGSLIKNPGGGIARGGGYIVGKKEYITLAAYKLNSIGVGKKAGATYGFTREILQGFFLAPHVTGQALKAALFCGGMFELLGFEICPNTVQNRYDIIQAIKFGSPELVIEFCKGIQKGAPVDSFVLPEPWTMPGYDCDVIMAAGAFVQGATTELSADAPMKPPYIAYMQGSLTAECGKIGVMVAVQNMLSKGLIALNS